MVFEYVDIFSLYCGCLLVNFRPFAGIPFRPSITRARDLTLSRRIFRTPTEAVFFLGERAMRQLSHDYFVTPVDPPNLMMSYNLARLLGNDPDQAVALDTLLLEDVPYDLHLLPRLASRVRYVSHPVVCFFYVAYDCFA